MAISQTRSITSGSSAIIADEGRRTARRRWSALDQLRLRPLDETYPLLVRQGTDRFVDGFEVGVAHGDVQR